MIHNHKRSSFFKKIPVPEISESDFWDVRLGGDKSSSHNHPNQNHGPMDNDLYYSEKVFEDSFTYGKWVPLLCADVGYLRPFDEIYKRAPLDGFSLPRSNGPFFFRNHPINYVAVTGHCHSAQQLPIEGTRNVILILYRMLTGAI